MKYRFIGKPDRIFPHLVTGKVYDLTIESQNFTPVIVRPFVCPYTSWNAFLQNWGPVKTTKKTAKPIGDAIDVRLVKQLKAARAKVMLMEYGERASYFEKFPMSRDEEDVFLESRREAKRILKAERRREANEYWFKFAYFLIAVALLYAILIILCTMPLRAS